MEKRTLAAVVVFLLLGIGGYAAMRAPQKGERRGPPPRPFASIKAADITGLETTNQKGEKTTLARKDGTWRITSPGDWAADASAVKTLTEGIEKLSFGDVVTENAGKQAELEVGDTGSVRLKIITPSQSPEVLLGKPVSGFGMLRVAGKNEIWQTSGLLSFNANKSIKDWRDHAILPVVATAADKLTVEVPGGAKLVVAREADAADAAAKKAPSSHWKVLESTGDGPKAGEAFDESQPQTVLQALQGLKATEFADGKSATEAGLDQPQLLITASTAGKDQTLEVGARQGEDVYVRARGAAPIYLVKRYILERAMARPIDYRDKTLANVKGDELTHLRVVQGKDTTDVARKDGKWVLASGAADDKKLAALAKSVESLYGTSFVTDKAAKTGLDAPRATITVEQKSGPKIVLKVGSVTADGGDYYVTAAGSKDVFVTKKFAIDRLLKKPSDLAPAPPKK
jgi:Domain of unknown function (DUF4340)